MSSRNVLLAACMGLITSCGGGNSTSPGVTSTNSTNSADAYKHLIEWPTAAKLPNGFKLAEHRKDAGYDLWRLTQEIEGAKFPTTLVVVRTNTFPGDETDSKAKNAAVWAVEA